MELPKTYDPSTVEDKWYKYWMEKDFFKSVPDDREPYTIVIPPPNVTGVLHMGHMLNNTIQDVLIRRARMLGKNACWVPGTDHASIATEAKVVNMLKEKGMNKSDLTREDFLMHAWEWKEKHGGIILKQLEKLGASCDWSRTKFTMDDDLSEAVIDVFIDLYRKGHIYRGVRMVNWDPQGMTAVSDEEVIHKEVNSKLYYVRYKIEDTAPPPPKGGIASNKKSSYDYETADPALYGLLKEFVHKMRSVPTEAENVFWQLVRGKKLEGYKFRRQHIIGSYIADFICLDQKLIVEIDGLLHQLPENKRPDEERTQWLNDKGFRVIRFTNEEVIGNPDGVLSKTLDALQLPPLGGGGAEWITIATVRPETILGDTAVCVHPDDPRYAHLKGKRCIIPIVNRSVPIIFDTYIDMEFGTGALKVTPAHDINDYNLGVKHGLEVIDTIAPNGRMSEAAGHYIGEDRFTVRKKIIKDLEALGNLVKVEDYKNKVGYSERTDAVIEPKLSLQWFLKMEEISKPALENVINGNIKLIPDKFINTYKHWMENVHDWCISRQLWWGQRIPAWYDEKGNYVVAKTSEEAVKLFEETYKFKPAALKQDEDVLDTWFSSWLWPISVFNGFKDPKNKDIEYYYPTNDLITAPEILFFWVARMIIAGYEYRGVKPFTNVYLTGIVRDKQGRKMSKSLGNSPDPIDLIKKYSADGVRVGMLLSSPAGNDLLFDEASCEQGRNFANKVWNAFRLVKGWEVDAAAQQPNANKVAIEWFTARFNEQLEILNDLYSKYRMSETLMTTYKLIWDDFCAWYLEMIKPDFVDGKSKPIDKITYDATIRFFENILKVLHPWMPFIAEEIWHLIKERKEKECIIVAEWPSVGTGRDLFILEQFDLVSELITNVRNTRMQKNISPKEKLSLLYKSASTDALKQFNDVIIKLCNLDKLEQTDKKVDNAVAFVVKQGEFYIPFSANIDMAAERERLLKDLDYNKGFLKSVQSKLANERFIASAKPEVIANEKKKEADAAAKIKAIEEQLAGMK